LASVLHDVGEDGGSTSGHRCPPVSAVACSYISKGAGVNEEKIMRRLLRFRSFARLPGLLRLALRLLPDPRVPTRSKALTLGTVGLILSPFDLPNWVPVIGQGFDVVLIVAVLDRFIRSAPPEVVREHVAALDRRGE
jgi:uncharacterized membrane protein YkvA (DUF1232 family)